MSIIQLRNDSEISRQEPMRIEEELQNSPPAQDSPQHILTALNDDCMEEILRRVENVKDFLNAAEICRRFQQIAKACFAKRFTNIRITDSKTEHRNNSLTSEHVPSLVSIFGDRIESIYWDETINNELDTGTLNIIADFCGKTLTDLRIYHIDCVDFNTRQPFQALKVLHLHDVKLVKLNVHACHLQLETLFLQNVKGNLDWIQHEFPNLKVAHFNYIDGLTDSILTEFLRLRLNGQLDELYLVECDKLTSSILQHVSSQIQSLQEFCFFSR